MLERLTKYRRDLHQIPELEFDLFLTHAYLKKILTSLNFEIEVVAKTGIIAYRRGKIVDAIAFRSDMDALPVFEKTGVEFKSKHEGMMHACGHDAHMAMLLCFAEYIAAKSVLNQSVVLIFQPAEEGPGGAKVIIEAGILEKYHVKKILGIHVFPGLEEHIYGLVEGPLTAQNGEFDVKITSVSTHGAQPHLGSDAVYIGSQLISNYQSILSRNLNPLDPAVLTVGTFKAGTARNIIAGTALLSGTIRAYSDSVYQLIKRRIYEINQGFELVFNCKITCEIRDYYPSVYNDEALFKIALETFKDSAKVVEPLMIAEDFAFYTQKVPGFFLLLGTKNEDKGYVHPLHSDYFDLDEASLVKGVEFYMKMAEKLGI